MSAPFVSKKRTTMDCGSPDTSRTLSPPSARGDRVRKRVTGTDATSRSSTLTPEELSPAMIARFNMRAERLESRDVTMVVCFLSVVA
jgi:hypothetical protein